MFILSFIFYLQLFRHSGTHGTQHDIIDVQSLREKATAAVDNEAKTCQVLQHYQIPEDEIHEAQVQAWSKFYSCCRQYNQV